jgi:lipopolysaccharide/colanic/teichoic acid biosynthesis glycosyltransferase
MSGYKLLKRIVDLGLSVLFIIVFSPLMLFLSYKIKKDSSGSAIFKQKRVGKDGKVFTFYKFRTMKVGAEKLQKQLRSYNEVDGPVFKMANDPRLTRIGKKLRDSNLDELPQLWNVVKGDMSLVGPRPPTPDEVKMYKKWQMKRLSVRPGITSLWHVNGRHKMGFDNWVKSDIYYITHQSIWLDFKILWRTFLMFLNHFR